MKKTYITPEVEIMECETTSLICQSWTKSDETKTVGGSGDNGPDWTTKEEQDWNIWD